MTSYEQLYVPFFNRIEEDANFFSYYKITADEALEIAKKRAKNYLNEAVSILKRNCTLDFDLELDDEVEMISEDLTNEEINLLADLMYEVYISRDIATLKSKANNIAYMSKVHNTIEKQMVEINRLANANGWSDVKVTGVEEASGKIQKLTLTVRDAEGALKQFNMQREKIQGNSKVQAGLVQTGDVKVLETAVQYAEKLKSIETSMGQFGNTTTLRMRQRCQSYQYLHSLLVI